MKHLLEVLECPFTQTLSDPGKMPIKEQVLIISWLEDRVIREMEIAARDTIRPTNPQAPRNIDGYLKRIGCPFAWYADSPARNLDALYWALSQGVSLKYEDEASSMDAEDPLHQDQVNIDVSAKMNDLGAQLGLARNLRESNSDYMRRLIERAKKCLVVNTEGAAFSLDELPLGFDSGDKLVNDVAKVLKMLYVSDFRELQDEVNDLIVLCQEHTANPRLQASLGKVGR